MYPVGLLFGLGFDTATEIGLLAIAAAQANQGLPLHAVLVFPALFTAGMTLIDSTDNVLMVHAYGWAMDDPKRKLAYNLSITFVSAAVALLVIGGVEALGLAADKLGLAGGFWDAIGAINDRFGAIGYGVVALFLACWVGSILFHRWRHASSQLAWRGQAAPLQHLQRPFGARRLEGHVQPRQRRIVEQQVERGAIGAHMLDRARLRNRQHLRASQHPGQHRLLGRHVALGGNLVEHGAARQPLVVGMRCVTSHGSRSNSGPRRARL